MTLEKDQIVTCNLTFQTQILRVHKEDNLIEFKSLSDDKRYMLTIDTFEKLIQLTH